LRYENASVIDPAWLGVVAIGIGLIRLEWDRRGRRQAELDRQQMRLDEAKVQPSLVRSVITWRRSPFSEDHLDKIVSVQNRSNQAVTAVVTYVDNTRKEQWDRVGGGDTLTKTLESVSIHECPAGSDAERPCMVEFTATSGTRWRRNIDDTLQYRLDRSEERGDEWSSEVAPAVERETVKGYNSSISLAWLLLLLGIVLIIFSLTR
jgi:hypothetical protein